MFIEGPRSYSRQLETSPQGVLVGYWGVFGVLSCGRTGSDSNMMSGLESDFGNGLELKSTGRNFLAAVRA